MKQIEGPGEPFGAWRGLEGCVEEEYLVSGGADAIDPDHRVLAHDVPYTTRILVRRPVDSSRPTGTVVVEPFHNIAERAVMWSYLAEWIMGAGHTWIGMTTHTGTFANHFGRQPGGVPLLQASNGERYGALHLQPFDLPPPRRMHQGPAGFDPLEMHWRLTIANPQGSGIAADVVHAVRAGELPGVGAARVIAMGASQTARFWRLVLDGGSHSGGIDAYLLAVGPAPEEHPPDITLVQVLTEAEVVGTLNPRWLRALDDSGAPRARGYEIPGTSHDIWSRPAPPGHDRMHNVNPVDALVRAVAANLNRWLRDGVPMPASAHILRDDRAFDGVARDDHGNALGGLRGPWLDVPTAQYFPRCSCSPTVSEMLPFPEDTVAALYGSRTGYEEAFRRRVDELEGARVLLPADASRLRDARGSGLHQS